MKNFTKRNESSARQTVSSVLLKILQKDFEILLQPAQAKAAIFYV